MKDEVCLRRLISGIVMGVLFGALPARAFMESEDQQFQAEINEARARAQDFENTLRKMKEQDRAREQASKLIGPEREREAAELERDRAGYVKERNRLEPEELALREKWEREDDREKEKEARQMEEYRREYVSKRDRVRRVIGKEAYIDEAREYDLGI